MTNLGAFTGAAYQTWLSVNAAQRLASIVATSDDAIVSKTLDGIVTSWNRGAERLFGYSSDQAVGKSIMMVIPAERQHEENRIMECIRRGERVESYETVRRRKDGSEVEISLTVSPVVDSEGKITGASKIARDITERKKIERQLALLAREAEHRTKNILSTVQATVSLSQSDTVDGLKQAIAGRLQALASVHRLFVDSRWTGADLRTIASEECRLTASWTQTGRRSMATTCCSSRLWPRPSRSSSMNWRRMRPSTAHCRDPKEECGLIGPARTTTACMFAGWNQAAPRCTTDPKGGRHARDGRDGSEPPRTPICNSTGGWKGCAASWR